MDPATYIAALKKSESSECSQEVTSYFTSVSVANCSTVLRGPKKQKSLGSLFSHTYATGTCPFGSMCSDIACSSDPDKLLADSQLAADPDVKQVTTPRIYKTRFLPNRDRRLGVNVK